MYGTCVYVGGMGCNACLVALLLLGTTRPFTSECLLTFSWLFSTKMMMIPQKMARQRKRKRPNGHNWAQTRRFFFSYGRQAHKLQQPAGASAYSFSPEPGNLQRKPCRTFSALILLTCKQVPVHHTLWTPIEHVHTSCSPHRRTPSSTHR